MKRRLLIGILGGMGCLASIEFLNTLYKVGIPYKNDDEMPQVLYLSLNNIPDRTFGILNGDSLSIQSFINKNIHIFLDCNIDVLIIPCITFHFYLEYLPEELKKKTLNLIDVIESELNQKNEEGILLASLGTYHSKLFKNDKVIYPEEKYQDQIHEIIYEIKANGSQKEVMYKLKKVIEELLKKFNKKTIIVGCTEIHIAVNYFKKNDEFNEVLFVDPLFIVAEKFLKEE
ncbi:aspartate/glutamate racemase family protein [Fusobacterium necrophorum subsp. funduliforme]